MMFVSENKTPKYSTSKLFLSKLYHSLMKCMVIKIVFMKNFNKVGLRVWYDVTLDKIL